SRPHPPRDPSPAGPRSGPAPILPPAPGRPPGGPPPGPPPPSAFRPYASRKRWIRTANDSYFTAMTYPYIRHLQPEHIHDALWGVASAVYGGALHPTAQGYAAMADAALPAARRLLGLPQVQTSAVPGSSP